MTYGYFDMRQKRSIATAAFSVASLLLITLAVSVISSFAPDAGKLSWLLISFFSGVSMITFPFMLPLAFIVAPSAVVGGVRQSFKMILSFGAGTALALVAYGAIIAVAGKLGLSLSGVTPGDIKGWAYLFAGVIAYVFALREIGLIRLDMSFVEDVPVLFRARKNVSRMFFLGLFLGSVSIGYPHPATPLLLIEAASSSDVFYGMSLFFVHTLGRIAPLFVLAYSGFLGMQSVHWIVARKKKIERAIGWIMIYVSGFIFYSGFLSSIWFLYKGGSISDVYIMYSNGILFLPSIPLDFWRSFIVEGNLITLIVWLIPLWWDYMRERKRIWGSPAFSLQKLQQEIERAESQRRYLEATMHMFEGREGRRMYELEAAMDKLEKERKILEEAMRYGAQGKLRNEEILKYEEEILRIRKNWYLSLSLLLLLALSFLPQIVATLRVTTIFGF